MNNEIRERELAKIREKAAATAANLEAIRNIDFTISEYCLIAEALLHVGFSPGNRRICRRWYLIEVVATNIHHGFAESRWKIDLGSFLYKINQLSQEQAETLIKAIRGFWKVTRLPAHGGSTSHDSLVADARQSLMKVGLLKENKNRQ